ncbi:G-type lectin S-receptor-like serine/threonine-protein kinase At1g11330 [Cucurbita moschata]|uniref:Receptor-like serine/threonine-protein kinase n=1 Tax=Cucurbita moschata TaxID=3662 RepID=A0A6J1GTH8_CUCMO|nr:G-type lectin S-receptor-like serine/threonine-protein kinase At1g11330 [Cucurbita moschata]
MMIERSMATRRISSRFSYRRCHLLLLLLSFTCFASRFGYGKDTITSTSFIKDPATISSNGSSFELGFFSPLNSTARYVGIWYNQIPLQTVVWVANANNPLNHTSGIFTISKDGNLVVLDQNDTVLWSSNISSSSSTTTNTDSIARILDSGNLVLENSTSGKIIWESFKHPSDKFLTSMKVTTNTRTKQSVKITSWASPSNPFMGSFSLAMEVFNFPEAVIWNGRNIYWRSGPWNGQSFIGVPEMDSVYLSGFNLVIEEQTYTLSIPHEFSTQEFAYVLLTSQGNLEKMHWNTQTKNWDVSWMSLKTECDYYGVCGAFGVCNPKAFPICSCLRGFEPRHEEEWKQGNWSGGCVRRMPLQCKRLNNGAAQEDGFQKVERVKVPYFAEWSNLSYSEDICREECLNNCSCNAYAYEDGLRCMQWRREELIDMQKFEMGGADLYLRMAYGELDHSNNVNNKKGTITAIVLPTTFVIFMIVVFVWCKWKTYKQEKKEKQKSLKLTREDDMIGNDIKLEEVPFYDTEKLAIATNNFALSNKLGQGGFGPVYKGKLLNGQEIAVKRLSRASNQGYEEFMNEVKVISKLQHRNLVRLFGCCIEGEEKMLIYEYMPHLSLDALIFGSGKQKILDWRKRFNIIDGIARGLLYLHRDSRLKIIYRDLKASNILLDKDLNPKISDFGMARIFCDNKVQANTVRVVGTYGYMSPEYAMQGHFSEKSDVFSFGVLLLEIISGRKNTDFYHHKYAISLLGFAWKLWLEGNLIPMIEPTIYELCYHQEILRCIHVGLLCVQEFVKDRPNVSTVISMLNSEMVDLPSPKQPGFVGRPNEGNTDSSQQNLDTYSVNNVTLTTIIAR